MQGCSAAARSRCWRAASRHPRPKVRAFLPIEDVHPSDLASCQHLHPSILSPASPCRLATVAVAAVVVAIYLILRGQLSSDRQEFWARPY